MRILTGLALSCSSGLLCGACGDPADLSQELTPNPSVQVFLTRETHPDGWGLSECLLCHQIFKIHRVTSNPNLDLEEIQDIVDRLGEESCEFCHGANGT